MIYLGIWGKSVSRWFIMTSSNGNIFRVTGPLWGEFSSHRWVPLINTSDAELWCLFLVCAWTNGWVNNRDPGEFRCHRPHYEVTIMFSVLANCSFRCYNAHWSNICTPWHSVPQTSMEHNNCENSYRFKHNMCGKLTMVPPASRLTWTWYRQSVVYQC